MDDALREIDGFTFQEPKTGEECWAGVRAGQGQVVLSLSRKSEGDVQVAFDRRDAERLLAVLGQAIAAS